MGLPGSGKTTLATELVPLLNAEWLNADKVRAEYNDWDFSEEGRVRQANRMRDLAKKLRDDSDFYEGMSTLAKAKYNEFYTENKFRGSFRGGGSGYTRNLQYQ